MSTTNSMILNRAGISVHGYTLTVRQRKDGWHDCTVRNLMTGREITLEYELSLESKQVKTDDPIEKSISAMEILMYHALHRNDWDGIEELYTTLRSMFGTVIAVMNSDYMMHRIFRNPKNTPPKVHSVLNQPIALIVHVLFDKVTYIDASGVQVSESAEYIDPSVCAWLKQEHSDD